MKHNRIDGKENNRALGYAALFFLVLVICIGTEPARAERDTLNIAIKANLSTLGLSEATPRAALILLHNWADTLVYRDPVKREIVPCLAESYRLVAPDTIEFRLRKGIKFHNGEPFDSEAVKFSMDILKQTSPTIQRSFINKIGRVTVVNEKTVHIQSTVNHKIALELLANMFFIFPPRYYQELGKEKFGKRPVGTGPYQFVSWENPKEILFKANPHYFGAPKGGAKIPHLKIRIMPEEMIRIEALLTGKVDLIRSGAVSPEQVPFLQTDSDITIKKSNVIRIFFLMMDVFGRSGVDYFKDRRVRRAFNHAIDKKRIVTKVLGGYATVTDSPVTPLHFGHEKEVRTYPYDPARAKKLLKEAGYPEGFQVDFYVPRDETVAEAVAEDLKEVGIQTNIRWYGGKWPILVKALADGKIPLAFLTSGSYSVFDASALLNLYFKMDAPRCAGSNREIDRLLQTADHTIDQNERKKCFSAVQKMITEEAYWVPLYYGNAIAAMHKDLNFEPNYDEIDRYFSVFWNE